MKLSIAYSVSIAASLFTAVSAGEDYTYFVSKWTSEKCTDARDLNGAFVVPMPSSDEECAPSDPICVSFEDSQAILTTALIPNVTSLEDCPTIALQLFDEEHCEGLGSSTVMFNGNICLDLTTFDDEVKSLRVISSLCNVHDFREYQQNGESED